ncbi:MAG: TonB-dependent receptor [Bacteroidaceae bacterium]|nr:TonB-dependent receptor [Bacteroidaceae bacterium]
MNNKQRKGVKQLVWKHYAHKGYSAFASMGREIKIGVLSVATLATVTPVLAESRAMADTQTDNKEPQELSDVVVTGTMAPLAQLQSARMVSVLTRSDIERAGVQSVNDLLKLVTSVDVRQRGGFGVQTDISICGGTYEQVTILLNGININNPHTGHLTCDFPVTISDIERIEVLEGAASRIYGGQAFGGAVNIVTRQDHRNALELGAEGGSHGTAQASGRLSWTQKLFSNHLSGGGGRSDGGTLNDSWRKGTLFLQGAYQPEPLALNWQFGFSRKDYGANTFYSGASNDQWEQNERYIVSIGAETRNKFHFKPSVYWVRTYDNYQWHKGIPNNSHQSDVYGLQLGGDIRWKGGQTAIKTEIRNESLLSSALGHPMDSTDYRWAHGAEKQYTKQVSRTNVSYNLEHSILLERWTLSGGLMANLNTAVSSRFRLYPGIDIAYRPHDDWKIYLTYNKGLRLPSFTDLFYNSPDISGNTRLKTETNRSLSVGTSYRHKGVTSAVRLFYNRGNDMIDYVKQTYDDVAHADNFNLNNLGAHAEIQLDIERLVRRSIFLKHVGISYTYLHQSRESAYQYFTSLYADDYLRHKLVCNVSHTIWKQLSANWSLRHQKRMGSYQEYDGLVPTNRLRPYKPYCHIDAKIQWSSPLVQIYVALTNLTNRKYCDIGNIPQPGVWVMTGARFHLNLAKKDRHQ